MKIFEGREGLREEYRCLLLLKYLMLVLVVEQVAPLGVLHHHVQLIVLREGVPEFDDVRVVHLRVQPHFPLQQLVLRVRREHLQVDLRCRTLTILMA